MHKNAKNARSAKSARKKHAKSAEQNRAKREQPGFWHSYATIGRFPTEVFKYAFGVLSVFVALFSLSAVGLIASARSRFIGVNCTTVSAELFLVLATPQDLLLNASSPPVPGRLCGVSAAASLGAKLTL